MIVSALLLLHGVELDAVSTSRRKGRDWELVVVGRTKGIPDGAIITLRFVKVENRVKWKDGSISTAAVDAPWVRKVYAGRDSFTHVEGFRAPGEVSVEICFAPDDQESNDLRSKMGLDWRPHQATRSFRVGRAGEAAGYHRLDYDALLRAIEEARKIFKALATKDKTELEKLKKDLDKLVQKARDERSTLSGSARAFETILTDVYNSVGALPEKSGGGGGGQDHTGGQGAPTSQLTGEALSLEQALAILDAIREIAGREVALLVLLHGRALAAETTAALEAQRAKPDGASWSRQKRDLDRDIGQLKTLWIGLRLKIEGMGEFLDEVEQHIAGVGGAIESGGSVPPPPGEKAAAALEKKLRGTE